MPPITADVARADNGWQSPAGILLRLDAEAEPDRARKINDMLRREQGLAEAVEARPQVRLSRRTGAHHEASLRALRL